MVAVAVAVGCQVGRRQVVQEQALAVVSLANTHLATCLTRPGSVRLQEGTWKICMAWTRCRLQADCPE